MVVQCPSCDTRYKIDDAKLKEGGTKLRCSNCNHMFTFKKETLAAARSAAPPPPPPSSKSKYPEPSPRKERSSIFDDDDLALGKDDWPPRDYRPGASRGDNLSKSESVLERELDKELFGPGEDDEYLDRNRDYLEKNIDEEIDDFPPVPRKKKTSPLRKIMLWVGVGVVIMFLGALGTFFYLTGKVPGKNSPGFLAKSAPSETELVKNISIVDTKERTITNKSAGSLFVIEGRVSNGTKVSLNYIRVKGILFDKSAVQVDAKEVYAGNKLGDEALASMPLKDIIDTLNRKEGENKVNTDVKIQADIPFQIVFAKDISGLSEYRVEVISALPAGK
ncbi:MAG: zinc-ribbon domain-containing protein [Deltaproteobacteria bacterium]|nr:zinc-ribbon domain-containing protein [Deltaproteobacteria bacterium]